MIQEKPHKELAKLSESLGLNYGTLVEEMIYYFKKTGINPKDAVNKDPSAMVSALDKRIVSFMKVQERDILKPLRQDVFNYQNSQKIEIDKLKDLIERQINKQSDNIGTTEKKYLDFLNKINNTDRERTKLVNAELEKTQKALVILCLLLDDKNKSGAIDKIKTLFS
ncbi:BfmA/BtgA family mobilization protein [Flavobacterium sp. SOK18b]|uniref:BfmA/BtgA family mobilization protein n=1 Tax=Flavobacterium sp. SOK18b TaxID=797900 RepID=UPI0015FC3C03|nr:BfmA/BtgA family mobilization protein [Flavobacterium sp. SOK18b]